MTITNNHDTLPSAGSGIGEILRPGDTEYEQTRRIWNGAIDRHPAMIVRCRTTEQVAAAVRLAVEAGLEIAVRGGGHSIPGHSVCEGGLVIDLSLMKGLDVDSDSGTAVAQAGLLWADFDAGTQQHGLGAPGGEISHTGVAGLTLGGGIGWLSRKHGLACDNLIGVRMVLADGTITEVDDERDAELMWGLRGGGGNFGIVTDFTFRVHPVPPLYAGLMIWPVDRAHDVLGTYFEVAPRADRDLSPAAALIVAPPAPFVPDELHFQSVVTISAVWTGDPADGPAAIDEFRALGPAADTMSVQPYSAIQQWFDAGVPHGRSYHVRSEWLGELDESTIDELTGAAHAMSSANNQILVRRLGGAIADVDPDATAFRFRDAAYMLTIAAGWDDGDADHHVTWTRATWDRLRPWSTGGGYVNHLALDEGDDRVRQAYGDSTWRRLVDLKRRVDPSNVFHLNQNIDPSAGRTERG